MEKDTNLGDFWRREFWSPPSEKQSNIKDFKRARRLRNVKRDFTALNASHQWEPFHFLNILDRAINTLNIPTGYSGIGRPSIRVSDKLKIGCIKQYHMRGARHSVYHVKSASNSRHLNVTKFSQNYFNRINDYIKDPSLKKYIQELISRLSEPCMQNETCFAIDGTGFKQSNGKRRYKDIRTDKKEKRGYTGLHAICGVNSHIIPYAIVAKGHEHDNKFFKKLVLGTNKKFKIKELYVDSAYLSRENTVFCESLNIKLFVKPKENTITKPLDYSSWKRAITRYYEDQVKEEERRYSLRVNIESAFHMLKTVLSDFTRHKIHNARINEILLRVACHNIRCLVLAYYHGKIDFPFDMD
jgi:hypothetical protein